MGSPIKWRKRNIKSNAGLRLDIAVRLWPTICSSQFRGSGPIGSKSYDHRLRKRYLDAVVQNAEKESGKLNADWVDVLMGYQKGYSRIEGQEDQDLIDPVSWADGTWEEGISRLVTGKDKSRAKRIKALGNSVVPQCVSLLAEKIGVWWIKIQKEID